MKSLTEELRSFRDVQRETMEHMILPLVSVVSATTSCSSGWTYPLSDSFTDSGDHVLLSSRCTRIRRRFGHVRNIRQDRLPLSFTLSRGHQILP